MSAVRNVAGRIFKCVEPGWWKADDGSVLREEFRGSPNNHGWVAEKRHGDEIVEHYGIGLSFNEAARTLPTPVSDRTEAP